MGGRARRRGTPDRKRARSSRQHSSTSYIRDFLSATPSPPTTAASRRHARQVHRPPRLGPRRPRRSHRLRTDEGVPAGQRAPMLTLMGWLEWLKGNGTQAGRYLKHAATDAPASGWQGCCGNSSTAAQSRTSPATPETSYQRHTI